MVLKGSTPAFRRKQGQKGKTMDESLKDWKGTCSEVNFAVNSLISVIKENFSLDEKTAKEVFCECLVRNLVTNEIYDMAEFIITGEVN